MKSLRRIIKQHPIPVYTTTCIMFSTNIKKSFTKIKENLLLQTNYDKKKTGTMYKQIYLYNFKQYFKKHIPYIITPRKKRGKRHISKKIR